MQSTRQDKFVAWGEMPLWLPEEEAPHLKGAMFIDCDKAVGAGLTFRPLKDTIKDTLAWWKDDCANEDLKAGIERDREEALIRKWHETHLA
jgi:2'-hydroxyisoflavone reductase